MKVKGENDRNRGKTIVKGQALTEWRASWCFVFKSVPRADIYFLSPPGLEAFQNAH